MSGKGYFCCLASWSLPWICRFRYGSIPFVLATVVDLLALRLIPTRKRALRFACIPALFTVQTIIIVALIGSPFRPVFKSKRFVSRVLAATSCLLLVGLGCVRAMIGILALPAVLKKAPEEAEPSLPDLQIGRRRLLPAVSGHNTSQQWFERPSRQFCVSRHFSSEQARIKHFSPPGKGRLQRPSKSPWILADMAGCWWTCY